LVIKLENYVDCCVVEEVTNQWDRGDTCYDVMEWYNDVKKNKGKEEDYEEEGEYVYILNIISLEYYSPVLSYMISVVHKYRAEYDLPEVLDDYSFSNILRHYTSFYARELGDLYFERILLDYFEKCQYPSPK
jgi:hypothetical protein